MKNEEALQLVNGQPLELKPARQAAYGLESPYCTFLQISNREGYRVPHLYCQALGKTGFFKPQDFLRPHAPYAR